MWKVANSIDSMTVEVGYGWENVAVSRAVFVGHSALFSRDAATSATAAGAGVSARVYLHERRVALLVGYLKPSIGIASAKVDGSSALGQGTAALSLQGAMAVGAEFLLTRHFGIAADLGLQLAVVPTERVTQLNLGTPAWLGVVLHQ
jgi:hypothetical protein